MIDTQSVISDAQLLDAFNTGPAKLVGVSPHLMAGSLRRVAEMAIAAYFATYIDATIPSMLEQLDRVTRCVERYTGEVLDERPVSLPRTTSPL